MHGAPNPKQYLNTKTGNNLNRRWKAWILAYAGIQVKILELLEFVKCLEFRT